MIEAAEELGKSASVSEACRVLGVPRSSLYWTRQPELPPAPQSTSHRALSVEEKTDVHQTLDSERFRDCSPREVYTKPELLATASNQVWSWDITKLKGPFTWVYYYLYVILDIFSRYVVGWMIAECESGELAKELITATCAKEEIDLDQLTMHSDRGSAMQSKSVGQLLVDLGVTKSFSRPYTANDNPYSEAQFKTMKYRPGYPDRFGSQENARAWARDFIHWYNHEHHHTGLGLMTPAMVHHGLVEAVYTHRQQVLQAAYEVHPERFVRGMPTPPELPKEVWINRPQSNSIAVPPPAPTGPGAQAVSRMAESQAQRSLDTAEHLAIAERAVE
jgi:putative transposase